MLADAEYLDRSNKQAVQQQVDKIRAAGHVTAEDVQSCVKIVRVDDDMILKVRDIVSVARRKCVPRGCARVTPRVAVPAVWLQARAPAWSCVQDAAGEVVPAVWLHAHAHSM